MSNLGNRQIMAANIRKYMQANDVTPTDVCNTLKIPFATFSDWINAKTYPRIDKIEMLANYFGISKSELVEENAPASSEREITDDDIKAAFFGGYSDDLPKEEIDALWQDAKDYARFKAEQRRRRDEKR